MGKPVKALDEAPQEDSAMLIRFEAIIHDDDALLDLVSSLPVSKQEMFLEVVAALKVKHILAGIKRNT